jgi:hypothetical protein
MGVIGAFVGDRVECIGGAGGEVYGNVRHFVGGEQHRGAVFLELPGHHVEKALGKFQSATGGMEQAFPSLCFRLHSLCNHLFGVVGSYHSCDAKIENIGDVVNESVAGALMGEGLGGVAKLGAMAQGIHSLEHEAAYEDPQGWANAAALAWAMGRMEWRAGVASRGDAMSCFDEVIGMEKNGGCHEAGASGDSLASAQEHGEVDYDTIKTGSGVHVEGA